MVASTFTHWAVFLTLFFISETKSLSCTGTPQLASVSPVVGIGLRFQAWPPCSPYKSGASDVKRVGDEVGRQFPGPQPCPENGGSLEPGTRSRLTFSSVGHVFPTSTALFLPPTKHPDRSILTSWILTRSPFLRPQPPV